MEYKTLRYEKSERIGTITLNRPKSMNSLSSELLAELDHVLTEIDQDDDVKVAILTGSEKYFAAGADITEIGQIKTPLDAHRFLKMAQAVFNHIEDLEKPVIAAISGLALGGGCELTLACDLRIAADNSTFGQLESMIVGSSESFVKISSVMNGINGCSSFRLVFSTWISTALTAAFSCAFSP